MKGKAFWTSIKAKGAQTLKDPVALAKVLQQSRDKFRQGGLPRFSSFKEDLDLALAMLGDYIKGRYRRVPWQTLLLLVGSLIYFLNPLDFIPDFIPLKGLLDDATVLMTVLKSMSGDLKDYKEWRQGAQEDQQNC